MSNFSELEINDFIDTAVKLILRLIIIAGDSFTRFEVGFYNLNSHLTTV